MRAAVAARHRRRLCTDARAPAVACAVAAGRAANDAHAASLAVVDFGSRGPAADTEVVGKKSCGSVGKVADEPAGCTAHAGYAAAAVGTWAHIAPAGHHTRTVVAARAGFRTSRTLTRVAQRRKSRMGSRVRLVASIRTSLHARLLSSAKGPWACWSWSIGRAEAKVCGPPAAPTQNDNNAVTLCHGVGPMEARRKI